LAHPVLTRPVAVNVIKERRCDKRLVTTSNCRPTANCKTAPHYVENTKSITVNGSSKPDECI